MKINNIVIITDNAVKKYYVNKLLKILEKQGHSVLVLSFPSGEKSKNIYTVIKLQEAMLKNYCTRDVLILAVGGGVVGDVAGFVAATYLRGVSYIQIPTTLLAMVDSSIGGKTGINMSHGKNLMGAFHQPEMIIANINYLKTLPTKQIINGLVEVLKAFLIQDSKGFDYLNQNLTKVLEYDESVLLHIIKRAAKIKLNIIEIDPLEAGLRSVLNLGHTILHGYAVAYGILLEAKVSQLMGILDQSSYQKIKVFLKALGFDGKKLRKFDVNKIIQATRSDKKAKLNNVNYVLLKNIGKVYQHKKNYVHAVPDKIVKQAYIAVIEE
jgi:3-dehydroquinate synthase